MRVNDTQLRTEGQAYAAFASALLNISKHVSVDLALRWDAQRFDTQFKDNQLSPRLSIQYQYDPETIARLSWGRMAQTERPDELQVQDGEAVYHAAQRSTQTVFSLERRVRDNALLRIEAYDKHITDPTPLYENIFDPFALLPELEADRVRVAPTGARVYGAEMSLRWQWAEAWSGWTSYSWSEATDHFGDARALRTWDQKHSVATGLSWARGRWQHSGNVTWHSGWRRNALDTTPTACSSSNPATAVRSPRISRSTCVRPGRSRCPGVRSKCSPRSTTSRVRRTTAACPTACSKRIWALRLRRKRPAGCRDCI